MKKRAEEKQLQTAMPPFFYHQHYEYQQYQPDSA
ncbi:hypothetical protein ESA_03999 [Cronobacter sakazakii ATCC BAA-894]|uniref:Uncharacterized protein n=1 Tax=Cronobacter sakazakii (strain ATCC BAA-894) TaxID=290339 RepID=A7MMX8_CROS8|nr:hypothetical protein ESA_03999 [Cronobacter sakazakii ATCC BAA-894]